MVDNDEEKKVFMVYQLYEKGFICFGVYTKLKKAKNRLEEIKKEIENKKVFKINFYQSGLGFDYFNEKTKRSVRINDFLLNFCLEKDLSLE